VLTSPAVQTTISIDGIPRGEWGLDWLEMEAGEYYLSFSDVSGFNSPTEVQVTYIPGNGPVTQSLDDPVIIYHDTMTVVTANFSQLQLVTLTMQVTGNGTTMPASGDHEYPLGTVVDITAIPESGDWNFINWNGDVADTSSISTTITMDADKTVTANFGLEDVTPPVIYGVYISNISKTSADIIWTTDEPSFSQVEYEWNPTELSPLDDTLVTQHLVSLTNLNPVTPYQCKIYSQDAAGNLAISEEFSFTSLGVPAVFLADDWSALVNNDGGLVVTVSFTAINSGDLAGSYELTLVVNDIAVEVKQLDLAAGATESVIFNKVNDISGQYSVHLDGSTALFSLEVPSPAGSTTWWLLVLIIIVTAVITSTILLLLSSKIRRPLWVRSELRHQALETENIDLTSELERTKMEADETKRAWREVQEARLEAEEAKEAVTKAAEDAMAEATELKKRAKKELEESKVISQKATMARQRYQEAMVEAEEAKRAWDEAGRARKAGRKDSRPRIEAQEAEARAENLVIMMEPASVSKTKHTKDVEFEGLKVTAQAIEMLERSLEKVGDKESAVRIARSAISPNQFGMKVAKVSKNDYVLKIGSNKILMFDQSLLAELQGMTIGTREHSGSMWLTIAQQPTLSIEFE
jgi:hypothetical protein